MDTVYILALLFLTLIFIILPVGLIGLLYWFLKRATTIKIAVTICSILLFSFIYFVVINFSPRESFYSENFQINTNLKLPNSAKLIEKHGNNSIYNFGDYDISYMYKLSENDYNKIYSELITKGFRLTDNYLETENNDKLINLIPTLKTKRIITKNFGYKSFDILFMDDNKTIIFTSYKW